MKKPWKRTISPSEFDLLVGSLLNLPITRAWRGYGSALFLELGELRPADPPRRDGTPRMKGEGTIMIQWSWRVERARSIEVGSWSTDARIDSGIARLGGLQVVALAVDGRLPELIVGLSDGCWLRSFMTAEGQPEWTVFLPDESWLTVERGRIVHDTQNQVRSAGRDSSISGNDDGALG